MKLTMKLVPLALAFGLVSGGTLMAAAFLPLETFGRAHALAQPSRSLGSFCIQHTCRFASPAGRAS
jgi:hypothetical protein